MASAFGAITWRGAVWLPLIGAAALTGTLSTLALPAVLGRAVDTLVAGGNSGRWLAMALALIVLGVACELVDAFADAACVAGTTAWLRARLIRHVLAAGPERSRRFDTGDLVSRVSGNAAEAARAGPAMVAVVTGVLPPAGSLILLAYIDLWVAAAFLVGIALAAVVLWAFTRHTAAIITAYQRTQGRIAARLAESLAGARTIAAAGTVAREEQRILQPLPELHDLGVRTWRVLSRAGAQSAVVGPLVLVAVLAAGGVQLTAGRITPGDLFAASQYAVLGAGLGGLTGVFGELARAVAGARRASDVLAVPSTAYGQRVLPDGPGCLVFRDVTVRTGDATLLADIDLSLPGGAAIAVVGRSGAGKSALAAVAARLREPDEGVVLLDGVPLAELDHSALRAAVGCAFERPVLVGDTLADAIGLGLDRDHVHTAARATHAHDFVSRLPHGYDTALVDAPMSGGEIQRVGLARAWHANRLLVLDDATSSLDIVTEMQISRTLTADHGGRTRLIVTHRTATAARADIVVWLDDARVQAVGSHHQLWHDPAYREIFG